jgi:hypothetical protein
VFSVFPSHVLDAEIVDYQGESDWSSLMVEQTWGVVGLNVSILDRWRFFRLGAGRTFLCGFQRKRSVIVDKASKIILFHNCGGNVFDGNAHILVPIHGRIQVKKSLMSTVINRASGVDTTRC